MKNQSIKEFLGIQKNLNAKIMEEKWQPINTAPKDTLILLYSYQYHLGHFNTTNNKWWTNTDGTQTNEERNLNSNMPPTHWMPLELPPSKTIQISNHV